jgi:hypothetical protein
VSDGFLYWYQRGWSLAHQVNGRIAAVGSDFETIGEQVFMDRETLVLDHVRTSPRATAGIVFDRRVQGCS